MGLPLLLHVGYHKTATTWMQRQLFIPAHGYRQIAGHQEAFDHVVRPHGLRFDPAPLCNLIAARQAILSLDEVPVFSSEILSGHPFQGGQESDVYAERLARIFPDARVLISIRSQMRILPSVYMQYVLRGGTQPYDRFFDGTREIGYSGFTPQHFEYDLLVGHYQRLFGANNVYLLTQESLQKDLDGAVSDLAKFAGNTKFSALVLAARRPDGTSYPEYAAPVLRRINHLQTSTLNPWPILSLGKTPKGLYKLAGYLLRSPPIKTVLEKRKPVSNYVKGRFAGHYNASNARLAALAINPVDLADYE